MAQLKDLHSARELVDFIAAQNWNAVDAETRQAALHEIGIAICQLRERAGLEPFDDGLPDEPDNAFRRIKSILSFPSHNGVAAFERRKLPSESSAEILEFAVDSPSSRPMRQASPRL
jgi:hypothetical protein